MRDRVEDHARVLDLSCGDGFLLELLAEAGHEVIGMTSRPLTWRSLGIGHPHPLPG